MTTLFERLTRLEHVGASIGKRLGQPQRLRSIAFINTALNAQNVRISTHRLVRNPWIENVPRRLVGLVVSANTSSAVTVGLEDYELRLPRDIAESLFTRSDQSRNKVVVGTLDDEGALVGWVGSVLLVDDSLGTIWSIVLRRQRDASEERIEAFEDII